MTYIGTRLDTEESEVMLREVMLDSKLVFSKPQDRLFAGQLDRMDRFALRFRARKYQYCSLWYLRARKRRAKRSIRSSWPANRRSCGLLNTSLLSSMTSIPA